MAFNQDNGTVHNDTLDQALWQCVNGFYDSLVSYKNLIEQDQWHPELKASKRAARLSESLAKLLRDYQSQWSIKLNHPEQAVPYQRLIYFLAVWADEFFMLQFEWPGADCWHQSLIESQLFQTRQGGDRVFADIELLLKEPKLDAPFTTLVYAYLFGLQTGFSGRFRISPQKKDRLQHFQSQLIASLNANRELDEQSSSAALVQKNFPLAYTQTGDNRVVYKLPGFSRFWLILVMIITFYVSLAWWIWHQATAPIQQSLDQAPQSTVITQHP